jgi:hypothetical protein
MLGNRVVRIGLAAFAAMLGFAWISRPKSLNAEIEDLGIHLEKATVVNNSIVHSRNEDFYNIAKDDVSKLYYYLKKHEFADISGGSTDITWMNRPSKSWPYRHYQHVWILNGPDPQVEFEPPLR